MLQFDLRLLKLPLAYTWKLSRNASVEKINAVVSVSDGKHEGKGEAAPNIRYLETPALMQEQFGRWLSSAPAQIYQVSDIYSCLRGAELCNALRFALESAMIHYLAVKEKRQPWELLSLKEPGPRKTSFSLPVMEIGEIAGFYSARDLKRFEILKIKTDRNNAVKLVKELFNISGKDMIVDANEAFQSAPEVLDFCDQIRNLPVRILEQPMPAAMVDEYRKLKADSPFPLFGDESLSRGADISLLSAQFHGVNVKLMKTGGYLEAIRQLTEAKQAGLKTMIGCMVETTLGISSALQLESLADYTDLDGFMILKDEPFRLVQESEGALSF